MIQVNNPDGSTTVGWEQKDFRRNVWPCGELPPPKGSGRVIHVVEQDERTGAKTEVCVEVLAIFQTGSALVRMEDGGGLAHVQVASLRPIDLERFKHNLKDLLVK